MITIEDMVECAERELAMRRRVYPHQVAVGKLKQPAADHQIEAMAAILALLKAERDEWQPWRSAQPVTMEPTFAGQSIIVACLDAQSRRPYLRFVGDGQSVPALPEAYAWRFAPAPAPLPPEPPKQGSFLP